MKTTITYLILINIIMLCACENSTEIEEVNGIVANAGEDITIHASSYVIFDASKSNLGKNTNTNNLWLEWIQDPNNPDKVNLHSGNDLKRSVGFIKEGSYKFNLVINNSKDTSNIDDIIVTVLPRELSLIEDPYLETHVRYQIRKQSGKITAEDLLNIDSLGTYKIPFSSHKITSIKGLEYCNNVKNLYLNLESITDLTPLERLTQLNYLTVNQNNILTNIAPLSELTNLEYLNIETNNIKDITPLKKLIKLKYLNLTFNYEVEDFNVIRNFKQLEKLLLGIQEVNNIDIVKDLTNLKELWAGKCNITDISPLENLVNLDYLLLWVNSIKDIKYLHNMKKLRRLFLSTNKIEDISVLEFLPNLQYIELNENKIKDILPLVKNNNIGKGDAVCLVKNPLSEKSINEYIPQLIDRGVIVKW